MRSGGDFTEVFAINGMLFVEPYVICLKDISEGMPVVVAVEAHGLDEGHTWKVDALAFYLEARSARRFAIKRTLSLLDGIAKVGIESKIITTQARILMWKAEQQMKDGKYLTDKIDRLQIAKNSDKQAQNESSMLAELGYSNEPEPGTYYAKYRAH